MKLSNLRVRLLLGYAIPVILLIIVSVLSIYGIASSDSQFSQVTNETAPVIRNLEELKYAGVLIVSSTSELGFIKALSVADEEAEEAEEKEIEQGHEIYAHALADYRALVTLYFPDEQDTLEHVEQAGQAL